MKEETLATAKIKINPVKVLFVHYQCYTGNVKKKKK